MFDKAKWIWYKDTVIDSHISFYDKINFNGEKTVINLSCDGEYELYVNDKLCGFAKYGDWPYKKAVESVDVTEHLVKGENEVRINVWYFGVLTFNYCESTPGLIYEIVADGKVTAYSSEQTLSAETAGYVQGRQKRITWLLGWSYTFDMRKKEGEKYKSVLAEQKGGLYPRPIKPLYFDEFRKGVLIDESRNLYDLGLETVGYLKIVAEIEEGKTLCVRYGEHLGEDGDVYWSMKEGFYGYRYEVQIIGNGKKQELFFPNRMFGCRYLGLCCDGKFGVDSIGIQEVMYPLTLKPYKTKTEKRQKIYDTAVRTARLCIHSHYEDCIIREQADYSLDGMLQMRYGYDMYEDTYFQRSALMLMNDARREDGFLPITAPTSCIKVIPSFSLYHIVGVNEYVKKTGDKEFAAYCEDRCEQVLRAVMKTEQDGLFECYPECEEYWNFYEWVDGLSGGGDPVNCINNLTILYGIQSFCEILNCLGKIEKAKKYLAVAEKLKEKINEKFYNAEKGLYVTYKNGMCHQYVNSLAVITGVADKNKAEIIFDKIIKKSPEIIEASLSMIPFTFEAMIMTDKEKYKNYILNVTDSLCQYMLDRGATSYWETIKGAEDMEGCGSLCHGWSAFAVRYYRLFNC